MSELVKKVEKALKVYQDEEPQKPMILRLELVRSLVDEVKRLEEEVERLAHENFYRSP